MRINDFKTFLFDGLPEIHRNSDTLSKQLEITREIIKKTNGKGIKKIVKEKKGQLWRFLYSLNEPLFDIFKPLDNLRDIYNLAATDLVDMWLDVWWFYYKELCEPFELNNNIINPCWNERKKRIILSELVNKYETLGSYNTFKWYVKTIFDYDEIDFIDFFNYVFYLNVEDSITLNLAEKISVGDINTFSNAEEKTVMKKQGSGWINSTIDYVGDVGLNNRLFLYNNNLYCAYYDYTNQSVKLAISEDNGNNWTIKTVKNNVGDYNQVYGGNYNTSKIGLYVTNDTIYISLTDLSDPADAKLLFTYSNNNGNTWNEQYLSFPGNVFWEGIWNNIKVVNNKIYIVYIGVSITTLYHALTVAKSNDGGLNWDYYEVESPQYLGWDFWNLDIEVINNNVYVIGPSDSNNYLSLFISNDGGQTYTKRIISDNTTYSSMKVRNENTVFLTVFDEINSDLLFYRSNDGGISWESFIIDGTNSNTGIYSSLEIDVDGILYVTYYDIDQQVLKLAKSSNNGTTWEKIVIDNNPDTGLWTSIEVSYTKDVYIAYQNNTNQDLLFKGYLNAGSNEDIYYVELDNNNIEEIPQNFFVTDLLNNFIYDYIVNYKEGIVYFQNPLLENQTLRFYYTYNKYIYNEANTDPNDEVKRHKDVYGKIKELAGKILYSTKSYRMRENDIILFENNLYKERNKIAKELDDNKMELLNYNTNNFNLNDKVCRLLPIRYSYGFPYTENHLKIKIKPENDVYYNKKLEVFYKKPSYGGYKDWLPIFLNNVEVVKIN